MTDGPLHSPSRRRFLGAAAGTTATIAAAGCLSSLGGGSPSNRIDPVEPSEPREGSPGEFYYFLEEHGIEVEELLREDDELLLTYRSEAETVSDSNEEITIVYEIYKQALIQRGSEIEFLYSEISNPFDGQALGWGIDTEWIHQHDSGEADEGLDANESATADAGNETEGNETAGNETADGGFDSDAFTLWNKILNTKVYEEDVEAVEDDQNPEEPPEEDVDLDENETESDD
ncbi:twin-arginine translocation signal domain-containing protein [Natronorubrum sp. FCH18a]|uniref:twin-arginine translocation signal domain-containing protein n=1 Tax=Natronorubrum sp. FCH18a TaxID=3447018 RepID=UPI003F519F6D